MTRVPLLDVCDLSVHYGGTKANDRVSLRVFPGQVVGLIGANGAGKTSFIDGLTGVTPIAGGTIALNGETIQNLRPHRRFGRGMSRSFQGAQLFDELTLRENIQIASQPLTGLRRGLRARREGNGGDPDWALEFVGLASSADRLPSELSSGQRRLAGVARAIACRPSLAIFDEPAAGLDRDESRQLGAKMRELVGLNISVLLVDHDMSVVLQVCDYIYALEFGKLIASGSPAEVRSDPLVIASYLGTSYSPEATKAAPAREGDAG